jgi:hypothetical protein
MTTAIFLTFGNRVLDGPYGSVEEAVREEPFVLEQTWPEPSSGRPARLTVERLPLDCDR